MKGRFSYEWNLWGEDACVILGFLFSKVISFVVYIIHLNSSGQNKYQCLNTFLTSQLCSFLILIWSYRSPREVCKITLSWQKHTSTLKPSHSLRQFERQMRSRGVKNAKQMFFSPFLMAARHHWCHYRDLLWLLLIPSACLRKEPLVVLSSLFTSEQQFEPISNSLP